MILYLKIFSLTGVVQHKTDKLRKKGKVAKVEEGFAILFDIDKTDLIV